LRQAWRIHPSRIAKLSEPVSSIPNLGPASEAAFARAGITSADELRALGADEAYARLLASGSRPHFIGYYVLVMGLQGRPWNDCKGEEKKALRKRFDAICGGFNRSDAKQAADREQELQFLGVVPRK
jgi:DNA transformation protein and related proteins